MFQNLYAEKKATSCVKWCFKNKSSVKVIIHE